MDWTLVFTNLNYLSLFLLSIFAIIMILLLVHFINYWLLNKSCPSSDTWTPEYLNNSRVNVSVIEDQLRQWHGKGEGVLSKSSNDPCCSSGLKSNNQLPRYSNVLDLTDFNQLQLDLYKSSIKATNSANELKDPDTDSLLSVTTGSSLYMDQRLSVDLNERFFMYWNRYSNHPSGSKK